MASGDLVSNKVVKAFKQLKHLILLKNLNCDGCQPRCQ